MAFAAVFLSGALSNNVFAQLPEKFFEVSPGIYRSAQPTAASMNDLKALGIKTILDLNDDQYEIEDERASAQQLGINFISRPMSGFWTPDDQVVDANLTDLANPNNYPILVHCQHGEDRTGLIVGLHRVFSENQTPAKAYQEMIDLGFHKALFMLNRYFKKRTGFDD